MTITSLVRFALVATACALACVRGLAAQAEGAIEGRVQEAGTGRSLSAAQVLVDERIGAVTGTDLLLLVGHSAGDQRRVPWMKLVRVADTAEWSVDPRE